MIYTPDGEFTAMWLPPIESKTVVYNKDPRTNELPIAIYPTRSNPRIIGQLGVFTIHGMDKKPLNTMLDEWTDTEKYIARIDFVDFKVEDIRRELHYLGLRQSVFYPDADHIARDVGYMYRWLD